MKYSHLEGRKVCAATYRDGCRCPGCTQAQALEMRRDRDKRNGALRRVEQRFLTLLVTWARTHIPDAEREALRAQAYRDVGVERRGAGRPRAS